MREKFDESIPRIRQTILWYVVKEMLEYRRSMNFDFLNAIMAIQFDE